MKLILIFVISLSVVFAGPNRHIHDHNDDFEDHDYDYVHHETEDSYEIGGPHEHGVGSHSGHHRGQQGGGLNRGQQAHGGLNRGQQTPSGGLNRGHHEDHDTEEIYEIHEGGPHHGGQQIQGGGGYRGQGQGNRGSGSVNRPNINNGGSGRNPGLNQGGVRRPPVNNRDKFQQNNRQNNRQSERIRTQGNLGPNKFNNNRGEFGGPSPTFNKGPSRVPPNANRGTKKKYQGLHTDVSPAFETIDDDEDFD